MEMGEHYGRTDLEAIVKSTGHHQFLSPLPQPPPPLPPPPEMHGLSLPEMVVHNPFRLAGFFHAGVFGRQQHPGMMVVGEEEQEEVGHHLQGLVYPQRLDFFSGDSLPTTSTDGPGNAAALSANLLLGGHGSGNHNCGGDGRGGGDNVRRCMSSSPSGKLEEGEGLKGGGDGGNSRWPRHETLTLLELRAQLDSKFREATQKGPLWEELSREMAEGYGYHRSGKKCREKFENLYKYYKKTKEGRTGRQDGKHYRFYAQLEALCGGGDGKTSNNTNTSNMNSSANSDFDLEEHNGGLETMSTGKKLVAEEKNAGMAIPGFDIATSSGWSEEEELGTEDEKGKTQKKKKKESWKWKMKAYMEKQMKRLMDRQEEWFEKVLKTIERKEEERLAREEAWRREEGERLHREHEFWAKERAWIEARDATFMEAMRKVVGVQDCSTRAPFSPSASFDVQDLQEETCCNNNMSEGSSRPKCDMLNLVRLRAAMEGRLQEGGPKAQ
ncbi:Trihelix transcription factor [Nymphaea thermarum]|nr:Trihelix transcription factor [Nymphaea thermarum]